MGKYPKTNSEFYSDITKQIRDGITSIADINNEMVSLDKSIKSGDYAGEKLHEMNRQYTALRLALSNEREKQLSLIQQSCDEHIETLRSQDDLNPDDIVDGDLKLLTSGIRLSDRDVKAMLERNSKNRTMIQLILRSMRADNNRDLDLGIIYEGNSGMINNVKMFPSIAKTLFRYDDGMSGSAGYVYNEVLGEGTDIANIFSDND